jgi:DNA-binding protein H-NS
MTTLQELKKQRQELDAKIEEMSKQARTEAISSIRELIQEFDLTAVDVFNAPRKSGKAKSTNKIPAKYRDPVSGKEWTGRGIAPSWMASKSREEFLISPVSR